MYMYVRICHLWLSGSVRYYFMYLSCIIYCFVFVVAMMIVVKTEGPSILCQTDEVGELCLCADYTGVSYWGLQGISSTTFQVKLKEEKF